MQPAQSPKRQKVAFSGAAMDDIDAKWYEDDHNTVNDTSPPLSIAAPRALSHSPVQLPRDSKRQRIESINNDVNNTVVDPSPGSTFPCRSLRREQAVETYLSDNIVGHTPRS